MEQFVKVYEKVGAELIEVLDLRDPDEMYDNSVLVTDEDMDQAVLMEESNYLSSYGE